MSTQTNRPMNFRSVNETIMLCTAAWSLVFIIVALLMPLWVGQVAEWRAESAMQKAGEAFKQGLQTR